MRIAFINLLLTAKPAFATAVNCRTEVPALKVPPESSKNNTSTTDFFKKFQKTTNGGYAIFYLPRSVSEETTLLEVTKKRDFLRWDIPCLLPIDEVQISNSGQVYTYQQDGTNTKVLLSTHYNVLTDRQIKFLEKPFNELTESDRADVLNLYGVETSPNSALAIRPGSAESPKSPDGGSKQRFSTEVFIGEMTFDRRKWEFFAPEVRKTKGSPIVPFRIGPPALFDEWKYLGTNQREIKDSPVNIKMNSGLSTLTSKINTKTLDNKLELTPPGLPEAPTNKIAPAKSKSSSTPMSPEQKLKYLTSLGKKVRNNQVVLTSRLPKGFVTKPGGKLPKENQRLWQHLGVYSLNDIDILPSGLIMEKTSGQILALQIYSETSDESVLKIFDTEMGDKIDVPFNDLNTEAQDRILRLLVIHTGRTIPILDPMTFNRTNSIARTSLRFDPKSGFQLEGESQRPLLQLGNPVNEDYFWSQVQKDSKPGIVNTSETPTAAR